MEIDIPPIFILSSELRFGYSSFIPPINKKLIYLMSQLIPWNDAKDLINCYQADEIHIPCLVDQKVHGFKVDAEHLKDLINREDHEIIKVFILIGMKKTEENGKQVNLVLAGVNADGEIVTDKCYDYLDPCPNNCHNLESLLA